MPLSNSHCHSEHPTSSLLNTPLRTFYYTMSFLSVPDDIILDIASWIQTLEPLRALCLVNHRLHSILEPALYRQDALCSYPYSSAISWAAEHGTMALLQKALQFGTEISIHPIVGPLIQDSEPTFLLGKSRRRHRFDCKAHPIALAARNGHEEIVNFFLERGCSPHIHDPSDFSLLSLAVIQRHVSLIKTFLSLGVSQNHNGWNSHWPLQIAAFYGDEEIVELLLLAQPVDSPHDLPHDIRRRERSRQGALETALKAGHRNVLSQLLRYGTNLNFRFNDGMPWPCATCPLEWAIEHEDS